MEDKENNSFSRCNQELHHSNTAAELRASAQENDPAPVPENSRGGVGVSGAASNSPVAIYSDELSKKNRTASGGTEYMAAAKIVDEIVSERLRQILSEGWTPEHDDEHGNGDMALAAACYCSAASVAAKFNPTDAQYANTPAAPFWPWAKNWWKPKNPRRDLIRAAALIVAEIERLDRKHGNSVCDSARIKESEARG